MWRPAHVHTITHTDAASQLSGAAGGWGAWLAHAPAEAATRTAELVYLVHMLLSCLLWGLRLTEHGTPPHQWNYPHGRNYKPWPIVLLPAFNRNGAMRGKNAEIITDNQNVCSAFDKGQGSCAQVCQGDTRHLPLLRISGHPLVNHLGAPWSVDPTTRRTAFLKCMVNGDDLMLLPSTFALLSQAWGPFSVDLFASDRSHQLPCYYACHFTPGSAGVSAFCHPWSTASRNLLWAFPRFSILSRVWQHVCARIILFIVPYWPASPCMVEICISTWDQR
jgi:hypothetical protein